MARTRLLLSRLRVVPSWLLLRTSNRPKEKRPTANLTPVTRLVVRGSGHVPQLVPTASCSQIGSGTRMRRRRTRVTGPSRISASLYLPRTGADTEHTWLTVCFTKGPGERSEPMDFKGARHAPTDRPRQSTPRPTRP